MTLHITCGALFAGFVPFAIFFAAIDAWTPPCPSITLHHFLHLMRSLHWPNDNEIYIKAQTVFHLFYQFMWYYVNLKIDWLTVVSLFILISFLFLSEFKILCDLRFCWGIDFASFWIVKWFSCCLLGLFVALVHLWHNGSTLFELLYFEYGRFLKLLWFTVKLFSSLGWTYLSNWLSVDDP